MWRSFIITLSLIAITIFAVEDDFVSVYSDHVKGYYSIRDDSELVFDQQTARRRIPGDNTLLDSLAGGFPNLFINATPITRLLTWVGSNPFEMLRDSYPLPKGLHEPLGEYDYIIVGAGSAGSVLANRLTADGKYTVLLLEDGKPESLATDIPLLAPALSFTEYAIAYWPEKQDGICRAMKNRQCFWPRGRAVGGTSVINYMLYTRGTKMDWDRIAADGNYGWSYEEVLPYFLRSEKAKLHDLKGSPFHNTDGLLSVQDIPFRSKIAPTFLEAAVFFDNRILDYNSDEGHGFSYFQANLDNGKRCSAAKAFLHPFKDRANLHILPEARAVKVLIDKQKTAYGVDYIWKITTRTAKARKEVILSAGPIASPQLLMLSGIGPREHLEAMKIELVKDLRVGQTLYDHISYPGSVFFVNKTGSTMVLGNTVTAQNFARYFQFGEGPLTVPSSIEALGYIKTDAAKKGDPVPDMELVSLDASFVSDGGFMLSTSVNLDPGYYNEVYGPRNFLESFMVVPILIQPKSKGNLTLRDSNPVNLPLIYSNYLTERQDVDAFIYAMRYIDHLVMSKPFKKFGVSIYKPILPTCPNITYGTDEYYECALRSITYSVHHQTSTCKMGPESDPDAVVDPELRVHGVKRLRVADSSVIPRPTAAHTNGPAIMIGEKAADMIKSTWDHHV